LAVAETLVSRQHQVRLLVSEKSVDRVAVQSLPAGRACSVDVTTMSAVGYAGSRQLMRFCSRLAGATRDCARLCDEFEPDAVLGMGGFTSAPALLAARWRSMRRARCATLIHESNAVPGKANRWAGRIVDHVALGMSGCATFFGRNRVTVTGTPVRAALKTGRVSGSRAKLGLDPERPVVLVAGGSQGAHAVNELIASALPWMADWRDRLQFVHLTGERDESFMRDAYAQNGFRAVVMTFCGTMEHAYSAADLAVARSGAASLTELAAFGLPSVLIPYPHAAGNHQWHNARVFEQAGAAQLVQQSDLGRMHATAGERMAEIIGALMTDDAQRERMARAARALHVPDAAERVADLLEQRAR
jgi:UDP-N-acetylglucosamine--N-acetylmuramyl-(pentapeptide) pyrophosphoryl-undecaprenol N-acetylglucosamine transferase